METNAVLKLPDEIQMIKVSEPSQCHTLVTGTCVEMFRKLNVVVDHSEYVRLRFADNISNSL